MKLTGKASLCRTCGKVFTTTSTFDKHRTGKYPERRCLTDDELAKIGFQVNSRGRWGRIGSRTNHIWIRA